MHSHGSDGLAPTSRWRVACATRSHWLESRVGTLRGGATVFALALGVFGVRSIALPVIPGRDFGTYIGYYVQMWDWHSVVPMSQLYPDTSAAPRDRRDSRPPRRLGSRSGDGAALRRLGGRVDEDRFRVRPTRGPPDRGRAARVPGLRDPLPHAGERARRRCRVRRMGARGRARVGRADVRTIRGRRRSDCGGRARAPGIPGPRARLGAAPPPSHALGRAARIRRRVRRRRARGPGLVDSRERAPVRRLHRCARDRRVLPVLSRLHDRPHRPSRQRARLAGARGRGETGPAARGALPLVRDHPRRVLRARWAARVRGRRRDHRPTLGMGLGLRAHACRRHRGGQGTSGPSTSPVWGRRPSRSCGSRSSSLSRTTPPRRRPLRRSRTRRRSRHLVPDFRCRRTER